MIKTPNQYPWFSFGMFGFGGMTKFYEREIGAPWDERNMKTLFSVVFFIVVMKEGVKLLEICNK